MIHFCLLVLTCILCLRNDYIFHCHRTNHTYHHHRCGDRLVYYNRYIHDFHPSRFQSISGKLHRPSRHLPQRLLLYIAQNLSRICNLSCFHYYHHHCLLRLSLLNHHLRPSRRHPSYCRWDCLTSNLFLHNSSTDTFLHNPYKFGFHDKYRMVLFLLQSIYVLLHPSMYKVLDFHHNTLDRHLNHSMTYTVHFRYILYKSEYYCLLRCHRRHFRHRQ